MFVVWKVILILKLKSSAVHKFLFFFVLLISTQAQDCPVHRGPVGEVALSLDFKAHTTKVCVSRHIYTHPYTY